MEQRSTGVGLLGSANRLQLGTFGTNLQAGPTLTLAPGRLEADWRQSSRIARIADRLGFEAIVSVARWRGYGGEHDSQGACFDTFAWAAGIGAVTERAHVFSTCHMPTIHPLVAAKQLTTIDHISGGRAAINTVGGWFRTEVEMFGSTILEHDRRYDLAEEWTQILIELWERDEPFDFDGELLSVRGAYSRPRPLQRPRPPIMNAGTSRRGREYAARYADMAYLRLLGNEPDDQRAQVAEIRDLARAHGRDVEVWTNGYLVCRDTEDEAQDHVRWYAEEHGDLDGATNALAQLNIESSAFDTESWMAARRSFIAGAGGVALVGTAEQIVARLRELSDIGVDGVLLICAQWEPELAAFELEVLPGLVAAGLRQQEHAYPPPPVSAGSA